VLTLVEELLEGETDLVRLLLEEELLLNDLPVAIIKLN
jgi:hypothetical protein